MKTILVILFLGVVLSSCGEKQNIGPKSPDTLMDAKIKGQGDTVGPINSGSGG